MGFISSFFGYILNFLYNLFNNYGIAIIIFSILLRIILIPITLKQQKSMKINNKMQDEMNQIKFKYKNDPEKLNQATMELYKRENFNPLSGCLPAILQLVIILAVFWMVSQPITYVRKLQNTEIYNEYKTKIEENNNTKSAYKEIAIINLVETDYNELNNKLDLINKIKNNEEIQNKEDIENIEELENITDEEITQLNNKKEELNKLRINMKFLGIDLSKVPTQSLNDWRVYIIPILYVITTFISMKLTNNMQQINKKDNDKTEEQESMEQMSKSMNYMMPIMSISIAFIAPLGLALYWFISNVLMILERLIINKFMSSEEEK